MKAMVAGRHAPVHERPLVATDLPDPSPGARELIVRVSVCAVCRTDLHVIEGDLDDGVLPIVPGHQIVGTVDSTGSGCRRFRPGDRVGIAWLRATCGRCDDCRRGKENLCVRSRYTGYHVDGGYAELAAVHEDFAYAIPTRFTDHDAAPLLCAGMIGYRALARTELPPGGRLGLYGFGSSAHVVQQVALHRGAEVYVVTRGAAHRALAREMGALWVGSLDETPPHPLDGAIVFAPAGPIVPTALRALRPGGTVVTAGITMTPIPEMEYEPHLFHEKNLRSVEAATRADGEALLREAAEIPISPRVEAFPLEQAGDALIALKEGRIDGTALLVCSGPTD